MHIHFIQSDPIVLPASIGKWAVSHNHEVSICKVFDGEALPTAGNFDLAVILGGRMGAYEEDVYPWLIDIKKWSKEMIDKNKYILGVCLGAQIIADAFGGKARPHDYPEVGWFEINFNEDAKTHPLLSDIETPEQFFEFHFDAVDLPADAELLASSTTCTNQMFAMGPRALAVQFHPEFTAASIEATIANTSESETSKHFAQPYNEMTDSYALQQTENWTFELLDRYEALILDDKKIHNEYENLAH